MSNKLEQLYSLRKNFSVVGLTGRTGSGCSETALMLSKQFSELKNIREPANFEPSVFPKKLGIVKNFTAKNWKQYKVIEYKKVLLFILLPALSKKPENTQLYDYYRDKLKDEPDPALIDKLKEEIQVYLASKSRLITKIERLDDITLLKEEKDLKELYQLYWGDEFDEIANYIDDKLKKSGVTKRVMLLHHTAANFRRSVCITANEHQ